MTAASTGDSAQAIDVRVVSSFDDFMKMMAVRSHVFIGNQNCPYEEEFDGNDFACTHVLASCGDEPAGTLRLRFFADFAKLERVAVRENFRHSQCAHRMIRYGLELCRRKGYSQVLGHAQIRLLRFWRHFGFHVVEERPRFVFSDHEYAEIICPLERHPKAITLQSDPLTVIRPEGQWDTAGILDQSALRGATNPDSSVKK